MQVLIIANLPDTSIIVAATSIHRLPKVGDIFENENGGKFHVKSISQDATNPKIYHAEVERYDPHCIVTLQDRNDGIARTIEVKRDSVTLSSGMGADGIVLKISKTGKKTHYTCLTPSEAALLGVALISVAKG